MLNETKTDPLDRTGLEFFHTGSQYSGSSRKFSVSGFRDLDHAERWKAAYYERAMGYNPIIRIIVENSVIRIDVNEMTSCD